MPSLPSVLLRPRDLRGPSDSRDACVARIAAQPSRLARLAGFAPTALFAALWFVVAVPAMAQSPERELSPAEETALRRDANFVLLSMAEDLAEEDGARAIALAARLRATALEDEAHAMGREAPFEIVDAKIARWLEQAESAGADDPVAIALTLPLLRAVDPQRHADAVRRWCDAEPDNLAPLLHAELPADALLEAARGTYRAQDAFFEIVRLTAQAVERPRSGPVARVLQRVAEAGEGGRSTYAATLGSRIAAANAPRYAELTRTCRAPDGLRRLQCRHLGEVMTARGGTLIQHLVGASLLRDTAADEVQREQAAALRRRYDWLIARNAELSGRDLEDHASRMLAQLRTAPVPGEVEMLERLLLDLGIASEPPAGWRAQDDPALRPAR